MSTLISADGATDIIYLKEESGTIFYQKKTEDPLVWFPTTGNIIIQNTNLSSAYSAVLKVLFVTDININDSNIFLECNSNNIQIGSSSLNSDGSRVKIFINNVSDYPGFIRCQFQSYIYVYNVSIISNSSSLSSNAGWLCQQSFGRNGTNNYIINCSSDGDIANNCGGIVGSQSGRSFAELYIYGCSSSGNIDFNSGGIIGSDAATDQGKVVCEKCWSTGDIGFRAGGIFGFIAAVNQGYVEANDCYSTGDIVGEEAGGIFGGNAASFDGRAYAYNCYTKGNIIGTGAGGIFGSGAGFGVVSALAQAVNCYALGNISNNCGGIFGANYQTIIITNCYTVGSVADINGYILAGSDSIPPTCYSEAGSLGGIPGSWNSVHANTVLQGIPTTSVVGTIWVAVNDNTPYELNNMGYSPYTLDNINASSTPSLNTSVSEIIKAGEQSIKAYTSDSETSSLIILQKSGGNPSFYGTITFNSQTGVFTTKFFTAPGTYIFVIRSTGSYNITTFNLIVGQGEKVINNTQSITCCKKSMDIKNIDYETRSKFIDGNTIIGSSSVRQGLQDYNEIYNKKMAYAAKR